MLGFIAAGLGAYATSGAVQDGLFPVVICGVIIMALGTGIACLAISVGRQD